LTAHGGTRYSHATPSPRLVAERIARKGGETLRDGGSVLRSAVLVLLTQRLPAVAAAVYGPRGLRLLLNIATALLVLALPLSVSNSIRSTAVSNETSTFAAVAPGSTDDTSARAATAGRGLLAGSRSVVTVAAEDVKEVVQYTVAKGDTLAEIADKYAVRAEDLAFANSIEVEGTNLKVGQTMFVPPGRGALYFVKDGDTVPSVAQKFKVEPSVIMAYNRLYFEPEHFATDQLIFIPGADVPVLKRVEASRSIPIPAGGQLPARTGRLGWPVNGVITQLFWWGHTGVDVAAAYGSTIVASDDGVVVATGWVAVGGLRVCIDHSGGLQSCYYHTSVVDVSVGQTVTKGQPIAKIGMTGVTTGPHVHWELKVNGVAVNPLSY
jgi:murein DD-endopeptidase MepM/ murein hydrolase activator NlpD